MKILHTSDWHLGQYFMMKTREKEHFAFLNWLIETVNQQQIDVVVVAGDIFDSASPPSYARKLYSDFIVQLQNSHCAQLLLVSGNHDSVAVLNENKALLDALNVSVLAGLSDDLAEHLIEVENKNNEKALICALPFLRATDVMTSEHGLSPDQKQMNLQRGIQQTYQDIYTLAKQKQTNEHLAILATGHLTAVGCSVSESVRDIYIGTLEAFPCSLFPDFDYIALGHLHRTQKVQGSDYIRYSGSPIPLSFDESKHQKQVLLIEAKQDQINVDEIAIPCFQLLKVIQGDIDSVCTQLSELKEKAAKQTVWVEIKLKQAHYQGDLQNKLNALIEGSHIEILKVSSPQINESSQWQQGQESTLENVTPLQLFEHRLKTEDHLNLEQQQALTVLYQQVLADVESQS